MTYGREYTMDTGLTLSTHSPRTVLNTSMVLNLIRSTGQLFTICEERVYGVKIN